MPAEASLEPLRAELVRVSVAPDRATRSLEVVAILRDAVSDLDLEPVVVGGLAVTYWTRGLYTSPEADLLLPLTAEVERRLRALGFVRRGRHWILPDTGVELEAPASVPEPGQLVVDVRLPSGRSVRLLSAEEMVAERVREFLVWGGQSEPFRQVGYLLGSPGIDVELAVQRAAEQGLDRALLAMRRLLEEAQAAGREIEPWELHELAASLEGGAG